MSKFDSKKLIDHLNAKWQNPPCPYCKATSWNASDTIFEMRPFHGGGIVLGAGPIVPVIPITCTNCGHTVMINAMVAKVVDAPSPTPKDEEKAK
jgi:hypothetical protein